MERREYKVAIERDLQIKPDEFAALWNASASCTTVAEADTERVRGGILGVETINEALVVLGNIATGVASSAVYALIIQILAKRGKRASIKERPLPDGDILVVVEVRSDRSQ